MEVRQLIAPSSPSKAGSGSLNSGCTSFNLPEGGVINIPGQDPITLTADAAYRPMCDQTTSPIIIANPGVTMEETAGSSDITNIAYSDFRDPFYASTFPQCYALAATTVIAYTLVIMLFITPRSFLDGGVVVLGRRSFTDGGTGGTNIGGRPWLQKVAALFVAISLTIATVDTFRVAEQQYSQGIQNAEVLQQEVLGGTELKVIRIISEAFLWLAQAQTLIRLFPRRREKIIIKWTAFALIALGVIFDSLNSFLYTNQGSLRPRSFTDAIPALSYLFQLSLGVLYAAWVIYYSIMKKHYAYYHPQMRNMCLVALLSVLAVLVPVVFFILDIRKPDFTGWGDYVRWVGAAAASVIVWEWVERIEALEREEKKDGILGREVFDGDEMVGLSASEFGWPRKRRNTKRDDDDDDAPDGGESGQMQARDNQPTAASSSNPWPIVTSLASRYRQKSRSKSGEDSRENGNSTRAPNIRFLQPPLWPSRPPPAVTPISRTDTASADSTVYAVRYHPMSETSGTNTEPFPETYSTPLPPVVPEIHEPSIRTEDPESRPEHRGADVDRISAATPEPSVTPSQSASQVAGRANQASNPPTSQAPSSSNNYRVRALSQASQLFRKPSKSNMSTEGSHKVSQPSPQEASNSSRWDFRSRFEDFAVSQADRLRDRIRPNMDTESLPVTVIPAPPRRGTGLQQLREEQSHESQPRLAPPALQIQTSSSNVTQRTSPPDSGPVSPRLWRSNSGASAAVVSPLTADEASGPPPSEPLSPIAAGKRPAAGPNHP
ncbi:hypothetical protein INS49_006985 [Diaporthe citri]|uniref:uncharacterized protein n=1 Tax=Diaporthe citri TaxID=83186 RepID=UPI001C802C5E|nr:uncharacterized protein INS49_006985 [Diaporthe citri]KAG6365374.1 hypothetical protein INS49_006985 [Diaporthe citri]